MDRFAGACRSSAVAHRAGWGLLRHGPRRGGTGRLCTRRVCLRIKYIVTSLESGMPGRMPACQDSWSRARGRTDDPPISGIAGPTQTRTAAQLVVADRLASAAGLDAHQEVARPSWIGIDSDWIGTDLDGSSPRGASDARQRSTDVYESRWLRSEVFTTPYPIPFSLYGRHHYMAATPRHAPPEISAAMTRSPRNTSVALVSNRAGFGAARASPLSPSRGKSKSGLGLGIRV
jgi:hypothetical protein